MKHRIGDPRIIRLIGKWLKAGTLEEGKLVASEEGTPQGAVISPLLANIYLHYVFDLWAHQWRQRHAQGNVVIVRYADDIVVGVDKESDARRFVQAMRSRLEQFALALHPEKTRVIEFGRFAADNRGQAGSGQAADVQLPRIHAHQWARPARQVHAAADHPARPDGLPR